MCYIVPTQGMWSDPAAKCCCPCGLTDRRVAGIRSRTGPSGLKILRISLVKVGALFPLWGLVTLESSREVLASLVVVPAPASASSTSTTPAGLEVAVFLIYPEGILYLVFTLLKRVLWVLVLLFLFGFSIVRSACPLELVPGAMDMRTKESPSACPPQGRQLEVAS